MDAEGLPSMNAIFKKCLNWLDSRPAFPPEAYSYEELDPKEIEKIQNRANEYLRRKTWITVERLGDGPR